MNKLVITFITIALSACAYNNFKSRIQVKETEFDIEPGKGIGFLLLNKTTMSQVINYIGAGGKAKYNWSSGRDGSITVIKYVYPKLGIEIEYSHPVSSKKGDSISVIRLIEPCKFETKDGIKIGSNRLTIERIMGQPKGSQYAPLNNGEIYHSLTYDRINFVFNTKNNASDSMLDTVKEITLY